MLAERQAQVEEELSQDEAEFERIRREREELERQLAEMEAVDEPPPPAKTPPRPQRRRRRRKPPKEVAPIQSPPPEEPTAILYGDMRDVGGRVEVFLGVRNSASGPKTVDSYQTGDLYLCMTPQLQEEQMRHFLFLLSLRRRTNM